MSKVKECPKCGFAADESFDECPQCGVIISKFLEREKERKGFEDQETRGRNLAAGNLADANAIIIRQQKEWGEILTGFETRNKYSVMDIYGNPLFEAEEQGGSLSALLSRFLLTALRPFTIDLFSTDGYGLFTLKRPFRFYFHELGIYKSGGALLGKVQRRFAVVRRIYSVQDRHGKELFELFGPFLHPWTFEIYKDGRELGKITKKWSGLLKESFTDADNFGITFPKELDVNQKAILLGAVFLIDFVHFEKKNN
jgi:hypothetical protein